MSFQRLTYALGQCLSLLGTDLTNAFVAKDPSGGGGAFALQGTDEIDVEIFATFKAATAVTSITFALEVSDDGSTWEPIQATQQSTGSTDSQFSVDAVADSTIPDRLLTSSHRNAKFVRVVAKCAGTSAAGDGATAKLNASE